MIITSIENTFKKKLIVFAAWLCLHGINDVCRWKSCDLVVCFCHFNIKNPEKNAKKLDS